MSVQKTRAQVNSILEGNGLTWTARADRLVLRFSSAIVIIGFRPWGAQTLIELRSNVLRDVSADRLQVLEHVNSLNSEEVFGRWVFYPEGRIVALEYDMLGDHLQEPELMAAFTSIAQLADHYDDLLQQDIGGHRGVD